MRYARTILTTFALIILVSMTVPALADASSGPHVRLSRTARGVVGGIAVATGFAVAAPPAQSPALHGDAPRVAADAARPAGAVETFYVSPDGSDANSGLSPAQPWRTLTRVNAAALQPGDTVLFQGGAEFDGQLMPSASGTQGAPIRFSSYGTGDATISGGAWFVQDHLGFDHLLLHATFFGGSNNQGQSNNITVTDCTVVLPAGNQSLGLYANGNDWTIKGNVVRNTGLSGMLINGSHYRIEANHIDNVGLYDAGYNAHGIYLDASNSIIAHNIITHFSTSAVSVRYQDNTIEDNFLSDGKIGIDFYQSGSTPGVTRWVRNVITDTTVEGLYVSPNGAYPLSESFVIQSNKIAPTSGGLVNAQAPTAGNYNEHANVRIARDEANLARGRVE